MPSRFPIAEIVSGYLHGHFLMDNGAGLAWYSSRRHALIPLDTRFHTPRSLHRALNSGRFEVRINADFPGVIEGCRNGGRATRDGEWISDELQDIYLELRHAGVAHSFETWVDERLAGGVLGLSLGGAFIGESMFHNVTDASKVAMVNLVNHLRTRGFTLFDAQVQNPHLSRFGAFEIGEREYTRSLAQAVKLEVRFD
jgi:leucyl/phenylalanyl-tRNA---protein transferase